MKTDTLERPSAGSAGSRDAERPTVTSSAQPMPGGMDFSTFAISLGSNVMLHLGLVDEDGAAVSAPPDYVLAQQTIDILAMLEVKTRGNLTADEASLLSSILYQSRVAFLEVRKRFGA